MNQKMDNMYLHFLKKNYYMINKLFDYFQLLGFSPEEIMQNTLAKKPLEEQIVQLKTLTKEVVDKLMKEVKNNA